MGATQNLKIQPPPHGDSAVALSYRIAVNTFATPIAIARGTIVDERTIVVCLTDRNGVKGFGEACGVPYRGETVESMTGQLEKVRDVVQGGCSRQDLLSELDSGGARFALDSALLDLEAKQTGRRAYEILGLGAPKNVRTCFTIGIGDAVHYESRARQHRTFATLKVKVNGENPIAALEAVRRGAPEAKLVVDPNQSWSVAQLKAFMPRLVASNVNLIEQPIPVGDEVGLRGYRSPIALCADELIETQDDLDCAEGSFTFINIKLDKAGGLTAALDLAAAARARGFRLMVGCMGGTSLCIAPAVLLAQMCEVVDLDSPLLIADDCAHGLSFDGDVLSPPISALWG
ncbi:MAG: dipeptide epimerase [Proteobacteria bacterium]|nr:dipeptide epimerase [Pseudomonadota bacterium]